MLFFAEEFTFTYLVASLLQAGVRSSVHAQSVGPWKSQGMTALDKEREV